MQCLQNCSLSASQPEQGPAALRYRAAVAEETLWGVFSTITEHAARFPKQYLQFTYGFLNVER